MTRWIVAGLLLVSASAWGSNRITQSNDNNAQTTGDVEVDVDVGGTEVSVGGPTTNVTVEAPSIDGGSTTVQGGDTNIDVERSAPGFGVAGVYSSHPCVVGWSASLVAPAGGGGIGRQRVDQDCADREWARLFAAFGRVDLAMELACASTSGQKLSICGYVEPEPVAVLAQVTEEEFETAREEVEIRITQQQNLIDSLEQQHTEDEEIIRRQEREIQALRQAQEAARAYIEEDQAKQSEQSTLFAEILRRIELEEAEAAAEGEADE